MKENKGIENRIIAQMLLALWEFVLRVLENNFTIIRSKRCLQ